MGTEDQAEDAEEAGTLPMLPGNETEQGPEEPGGQTEQDPEPAEVRPGQNGTASSSAAEEQPSGQTSTGSPPAAQTQMSELTAEELLTSVWMPIWPMIMIRLWCGYARQMTKGIQMPRTGSPWQVASIGRSEGIWILP